MDYVDNRDAVYQVNFTLKNSTNFIISDEQQTQQNCRENEHNTNRQCLTDNDCWMESYYGMGICRGGYCCEPLKQSDPVCDQGVAVKIMKKIIAFFR